jgi:hypothetical protein
MPDYANPVYPADIHVIHAQPTTNHDEGLQVPLIPHKT